MPFFRSKTIASGGIELPGLLSQGVLGTDGTGTVIAGSGGSGAPNIELGPLEVYGDSHISEFGMSVYDYGIAQKLAGILKPGIYRNAALGGSVHAQQDIGNGALGDGGWAHIANEANRQEQSSQRFNTTITAALTAGVTTSTTVTTLPAQSTVQGVPNLLAPQAGEWLVIGCVATPANTEIIQVNQAWTGVSPITFETPVAHTHASGDPIYHACRNEGYSAKSAVVLLCAEGGNDIGLSGPGAPPSPLTNSWQSGTQGSTLGASVGLGPFMQALRFTLAQLRCSVIYADTHPSIVYTTPGNWTSLAVTSAASFPVGYTPFNGFNAGNYHYTGTAGTTIVLTTAPDFPGGVVDVFMAVPSSGSGAIWNYSVAGATTIALTTHSAGTLYDNRNLSLTAMNVAAGTGGIVGTVIRIPGLSAGVNTITINPTTISGTTVVFFGWGIEAPSPPLIVALQTARAPGYLTGTQFVAGPGGFYNRRTIAATGATVSAGHGAASGEVAFTGGTVALGTAGTGSAILAQINDTITLDKGVIAKEETRRIIGFTGSPATACQVDANFTQAHTAAAIQIGLQDADYVGGGFYNTGDTQGKTSVPGLAAVINEVAGEFDANVIPVSADTAVNGGPGTTVNPLMFFVDGVHYNENGAGAISAEVTQALLTAAPTIANVASHTVPNKRTWQWIYGDAGTSGASSVVQVFQNGWTNLFSSAFLANPTTYHRTGYYKDMQTRFVFLNGAVTGGSATPGNVLFTLPQGFQTSSVFMFQAQTINEDLTYGIATMQVLGGAVSLLSGYPGAFGAVILQTSFLADS